MVDSRSYVPPARVRTHVTKPKKVTIKDRVLERGFEMVIHQQYPDLGWSGEAWMEFKRGDKEYLRVKTDAAMTWLYTATYFDNWGSGDEPTTYRDIGELWDAIGGAE